MWVSLCLSLSPAIYTDASPYAKAQWGGGILDFYKKRLLKIGLPVWIFALALLLILGTSELRHTLVALLNLQGLNSFVDAGEFFDAGPNLSHTWFVTVILFCYLLIPWLEGIVSKVTVPHIVVMWVVVLLLPFIGISLQYVALFITSYFVASKQFLKRHKYWILLAFVLMAIALRLIGRRYWDDTILYNSVIVMVSHFVLAVGIMLLIRELSLRHIGTAERLTKKRVFNFVERNSFYIYITHYCLIIPLYHHYGIGISTVIFVASTVLMSVSLGWAHDKMEQLIIILLK